MRSDWDDVAVNDIINRDRDGAPNIIVPLRAGDLHPRIEQKLVQNAQQRVVQAVDFDHASSLSTQLWMTGNADMTEANERG